MITVGCLLGGVALGVFAMEQETVARDVEHRWRRVQATVVDTRSSTDPATRVDSYWATLEYTDEEGVAHRYEAEAASSAYDQATYEIYYDPDHPQDAVSGPSHSDLWIPTVALLLIALVFVVLGIKVYRKARHGSA